uniref:Pectinesterase n=1 Tax=Araucaria cunninghamii TaxID=56994 RepID=A0A0D6R7D9_ARACU
MSFCHNCIVKVLIYAIQCSLCFRLLVRVDILEKRAHKFNDTKLALESSLAVSRYFIVDSLGRGDFRTVQSAVDAVPVDNLNWVYIHINEGIYREKVMIPYNKPNIIFQGAGRENTVITWSEAADADGSTADSATFSSFAPNFTAKGIGFKNAAHPAPPGVEGKQAVAALVAGDMAAFYGCGFYGAQDTLFDYQGRHYFKECYIEGSIDFIFGHGQSTYKGCELYAIAVGGYLPGSITAQNRASLMENSGFIFIACKISGSGQVFLGRAWGPYSRVIYAYTYMENIIVPQGWDDWGLVQRHRFGSTISHDVYVYAHTPF